MPPGAGKHTYLFKGSSKTNLDFNFIFVIPRKLGAPIPISHPLTGESALIRICSISPFPLQSISSTSSPTKFFLLVFVNFVTPSVLKNFLVDS